MAQATQDRGAGAPRAERKRLRDKTVSITLSLPRVFFSVCFFLFTLIWVFIFGIMLGRGHNPEEAVPELAGIMPAAEPSGTPDAVPPSSAPHGDMNEVLLPKDLKYHDSLKGKETQEQPRAAATPPPREALPQSAAKTPEPAQPSGADDKTASRDKAVYTYVYQVAASNNAARTEILRKKLQNGGLAAKTEKSASNGKTWYKIIVSFQGRSDDTRKLREQLAAHGINSIMLRGKTPAQ